MSQEDPAEDAVLQGSDNVRFGQVRLFGCRLFVVVLFLVLLVGAWRIFSSLPVSLGLLDIREAKALRRELDDLREDNARLARDLAFMTSASGIDRQANIELTKALADEKKRVLKTAEELYFYKKIVKEDSSEEGIIIRTVKVLEMSEGQIDLVLVLTRSDVRSKPVKGGLELRVQGYLDDESVSYEWEDLKLAEHPPLSFKFKYFHTMTVRFVLPSGFEPENILLRLVYDNEQPPVQQSFSWNSLIQ